MSRFHRGQQVDEGRGGRRRKDPRRPPVRVSGELNFRSMAIKALCPPDNQLLREDHGVLHIPTHKAVFLATHRLPISTSDTSATAPFKPQSSSSPPPASRLRGVLS
ncbi:uncharacterized protein LOC143419659 [Maylandia zebra]|uniref:uncharacterized protein LOC143419659 n=1 Tax=Maylandia zebra TaxID=106582 RepID=UPI00403CB2B0